MNKTAKRAYTLFALVIAFFIGVAILLASLYINGGTWASNRVNRHIYSSGRIMSAGSIYTADGIVLAKSKEGKRVYAENKTLRLAALHAIGDDAGFIATGIHSVYRQELSGYSFVNGVYLLKAYDKGSDIHLTLNSKACKTAYNAMGNYKGTVGVYNYKTGEILCMVSSPSFDINNKPRNMKTGEGEKYEGVYLNRFLSGLYTPGSIIKVLTASAAIENNPNIYYETYECKGVLQTSTGTVSCPSVHGKVNFEKALNKSCNTAFAQIAIEMGKEKLSAEAEALGFNNNLSANRLNIQKSVWNLSAANERDLGWAAIGQYNTLVNPCHMLTLMGCIANGGQGVAPYLVDRIVTPAKVVTQRGPQAKNAAIVMDAAKAEKLAELMRSDVKNEYGDYSFPGLEMCGKTGTAEVGDGKAPHAWFVGFCRREDMPFAVVVILENAGSGYKNAVPVANKVLQTLKPR
ncbi:MAG: penicillin-binding transpeptidase domain-containing protein [Acutalibacteraceae bacterium]|jgi:peptidoglycan glycosyltransferase